VAAGYVVGKTFRLVEWDLNVSPKEPNGDMVSVQVRKGQLSRQGIRECIATAYSLESAKHVKQFAHVFVTGSRVFYERIDTKEVLGKLDDGDVIVWTQVWSKLIFCTQQGVPSCPQYLQQSPQLGLVESACSVLCKRSCAFYARFLCLNVLLTNPLAHICRRHHHSYSCQAATTSCLAGLE
jgi:hypothetical protein